MMRLFVLVAGIFILCTALIAAARSSGSLIPPPPTFLDSGACALPCWESLLPGAASAEAFAQRLAQTPFTGHTTQRADGVAAAFELVPFGAIALADVLRIYGPPERVGCFGVTHSSLFPGQRFVITATVYFADGLVAVEVQRGDENAALSPSMRVRSVQFVAPGEPLYPIGMSTAWRGFTSAGAGRYLMCHP